MKRKPKKDKYDGAGIFIKDIRKIPPLSKEEEIRLSEMIHKGDLAARNTLVKHNLYSVIGIAMSYNKKGVSLLDLIEAGNDALLEASKKYSPEKAKKSGAKFSTYAYKDVEGAIKKYLRTFYYSDEVTKHYGKLIKKYEEAEANLKQAMEKEPPIELIAKEMNISLKVAQKIENLRKRGKTVSYDKEEYEEVENQIANSSTNYPPDFSQDEIKLAQRFLDKTSIRRILKKLTPREKMIMSFRFGFNNGMFKSLAETSEEFRVTKARICQIEKRILAKMREVDPIQ